MHKIILVDDHQLVLDGFSKIIQGQGSYEVISLFTDPREASKKIPILRPELIITDMDMPGMNGLQLAQAVRENFSEAKFILLTMHMNPLLLKKVKAQNFEGFLPKNTDEFELLQCLGTVISGRTFYSQKVLDMSVTASSTITSTEVRKTLLLTEREKEILKLIANGKSTREIAKTLFIAVRTVETHRKHIMEKIEVNNVAGMVRVAFQEGLLNS